MQRSEQEVQQLRKNLAKAQRDAHVDQLTGLPNRRAFAEVFAREFAEAKEGDQTLALAICDIDLFKRVNDQHGHDTGDRVIRAVGQALNQISGQCHVARHGGEEFVMLFRGQTYDEAISALDQTRTNLANKRFKDRDSGLAIGAVTFSGGVVDACAFADTASALRAADEALYRAKDAGRNRIEAG